MDDKINSELPSPVLPSGTVTFLFTDIEGSTRLLRQVGDRYAELLADQRQILRAAFKKWGGREVDTQGDSFFVSFPLATDAIGAAVEIQRLLPDHPWPEGTSVRLRMGLHTGEPTLAEEGYVGMDVHRAARIGHVGHGSQVLLSETTATLVRDELPEGVSLLDLGRHRLKDMRRPERIRQLVIEGLPSDFPPLSSLETLQPDVLLRELQQTEQSILTPFIGRKKELLRLNELLCDPDVRLVTVVGSGGMGKTRLALKAAEDILNNGYIDNFPNGVYFVPLASLQSVEAIEPTIAENIGFRFYEESNTRQQLINYLRQKAMLLILDNFEHLLDGVEIVTDILQNAANITILITSRTELHVQAEQIFHLSGMDYPDAGIVELIPLEQIQNLEKYSAVQLFQSTACRTHPEFNLSTDNISDVIRICHLVEGIPLVILLAAGWVKLLTPAEIAAEINQNLDLLESDMSDVPERQRSMRVVFGHTWHLLEEREREVFQGLSVFRGGFTRDAAQQVTGASLRELMTLVEKSLIQRKSDGQFDINELLRQYGTEKLSQTPDEEDKMRDHHAEHYLAYLQTRANDLKSARQIGAMDEIEIISENAVAAWNWASQREEGSRLGQASDSLGLFLMWRGRYQEGETLFRKAAEMLSKIAVQPLVQNSEVHQQLAKIMCWQACFTSKFCDNVIALKLCQESLATLEQSKLPEQATRKERATIFHQLALLVSNAGSRTEALDLLNKSRELFEAACDQWGEATTLQALGVLNWTVGSYEDAKRSLNLCFEIRKEIGDQRGMTDTLMVLGLIAAYQGELKDAKRFINESLVINEAIGYQAGVADSQLHLGTALFFSGAFEESLDLIESSRLIYDDLGSASSMHAKEVMTIVQIHLGQYEIAQTLAQESLASDQKVKLPRGIGLSLLAHGGIALVREIYSDAQRVLQQCVNTYRQIEQHDELGTSLALLGIATYKVGKVAQAHKHIHEALEIGIRIHATTPILYALPGLALIHANRGEIDQAVELYALASRYGLIANSQWFEDVIGNDINALARTISPAVVEAARTRGQARDLWATAKELMYLLKKKPNH